MSDLIQHRDINVGHASYRDLALDELLITKIFHTIQGEGPYAGTPAVFLRLAGCNRGDKESMGCKFCDTSFQFAKGIAMKFQAIYLKLVEEWHLDALDYNEPPLVVITGGEPMIQDNLTQFIEFLARNDWRNVQIESNGDRLAKGFLESSYCETVDLVVSPKYARFPIPLLKEQVLHRADALKILIDGRPESLYFKIPPYATMMDPDEVFLSPITVYKRELRRFPDHFDEIASAWDDELIDRAATALNYRRAAQLAKQRGYRVSMQQHLFFNVE